MASVDLACPVYINRMPKVRGPEAAWPALHPELLAVFCRAAQTLNFSRAAEQLDMAQPVVTRKIRQLEEILGVELFRRTNRGCELTAPGALLASRAGGIVQQIAQLQQDVRSAADAVAGPLSIGLTPAAGSLLAPYLAKVAAQRWPQLRPNFVGDFARPLCDRLLHGELSLALVYEPPPHPELVVTPLLLERLYLVGAPGSAVSRHRTATLKDLTEVPLILPGFNSVRALLEDAFRELGRPLTPVYEANDLGLLRSLAAQGLGCVVLTLGSVGEDVAAGRLVAVPLTTRGLSVELAVVTTTEKSRLRVVQLVRDVIVQAVRQLALAGQWPGTPHVFEAVGEEADL